MDLGMAPERGQVRVPAAVQVPVVEMVQEVLTVNLVQVVQVGSVVQTTVLVPIRLLAQEAVAQVQAAVGGSGWTTNFYPNADNPGVVEIIMR
jgi:hypothetical protein